MKTINLMTAHIKNPVGIDIRQPVLSWNVIGGIRQSAYEVRAFREGEEVWSTGKVDNSRMQVKYGGPARSRDRICWNVKVWDENGEMNQ